MPHVGPPGTARGTTTEAIRPPSLPPKPEGAPDSPPFGLDEGLLEQTVPARLLQARTVGPRGLRPGSAPPSTLWTRASPSCNPCPFSVTGWRKRARPALSTPRAQRAPHPSPRRLVWRRLNRAYRPTCPLPLPNATAPRLRAPPSAARPADTLLVSSRRPSHPLFAARCIRDGVPNEAPKVTRREPAFPRTFAPSARAGSLGPPPDTLLPRPASIPAAPSPASVTRLRGARSPRSAPGLPSPRWPRAPGHGSDLRRCRSRAPLPDLGPEVPSRDTRGPGVDPFTPRGPPRRVSRSLSRPLPFSDSRSTFPSSSLSRGFRLHPWGLGPTPGRPLVERPT